MAGKMDSSDFYFEWLRGFAAGISKEDIGKYVVATGDYLWHVFSWDLIDAKDYLQGQAARDAYDRVNKENAVYVDWFGEDQVKPVTKEVSTAKALEHFTEVYVAGDGFSWTYIKTHEGDRCGPYFYSRRLPDILPVVELRN